VLNPDAAGAGRRMAVVRSRCTSGVGRMLVGLLLLATLAQAQPQPARTQLPDQYFMSDGARIRYVEAGRGDTLVLIHGFAANLDVNWVATGVVDALAQTFRVVALDCRGHGKSDAPHDARQYGVHMVDDVRNLLDHLGVTRAHVVGYSMGGNIAAKLATMYPARLASVTIGGTGTRRSGAADYERDDEELAVSLEQGKGFRPLLLRVQPPNASGRDDVAMALTSSAMARRNDVVALAAVVRGYKEYVVTDDQLRAVGVPLMAVVGSADPNHVAVEALKKEVPAVRVVTIEGASHAGSPRGVPARPEFVEAIRTFTSAHPVGFER
jgi:pimeloyl-ACP methyl ester carboxylesterase